MTVETIYIIWCTREITFRFLFGYKWNDLIFTENTLQNARYLHHNTWVESIFRNIHFYYAVSMVRVKDQSETKNSESTCAMKE